MAIALWLLQLEREKKKACMGGRMGDMQICKGSVGALRGMQLLGMLADLGADWTETNLAGLGPCHWCLFCNAGSCGGLGLGWCKANLGLFNGL